MPQYPVPGGGGATNDHTYYSNPELYGEYQFVNLEEIIDNFQAAYVGEGKILGTALKADVSYHAHRALQELHYDTLTSCKSQQIEIPPSLTMRLPHDYVNYTKLTWHDENGVEHTIHPTIKTSNGNKLQQDADGNYLFTTAGKIGERIEPKLVENNSPLDNKLMFARLAPQSNEAVVAHFWQEGYGRINNSFIGPNNSDSAVLKVGMEISSPAFPPGTTITAVTHVVDTTLTGQGGTIGSGQLIDQGNSYMKITLSNDSIDFTTSWISDPSNSMFTVVDSDGTAWEAYKSAGSNQVGLNLTNSSSSATDNDHYFTNDGQRYGLDPQFSQSNGSFYIDCAKGLIHFSSNISGKKVTLRYLSDGHGEDGELIVHKLAEEAMYKWIAYGCASARIDIPEGVIQRLKREKFAETRKAKLRLSNIKMEEITQLMRGKSKWIKH
tara:strand:- start:4163 stop:5476 length:1314 start_codon:yes stop_codon:yes gene_type:complete